MPKSAASSVAAGSTTSLLIFFKATEYYHESIPSAVACLVRVCKELGWTCTATDDSSEFSDAARLAARYGVIAFVNNSGDLFETDAERDGLVRFVEHYGGSILGVHGAIAAYLNLVDHTGAAKASGTWKWYGDLMGAYFSSHPPVQNGTVRTEPAALAAIGLGDILQIEFTHNDEWYNLDRDPSADAETTVLAWADESSYSGGEMGSSHPLIWHHRFGPKRAKIFFSALGHLPCHYDEWHEYQRLLACALKWLIVSDE